MVTVGGRWRRRLQMLRLCSVWFAGGHVTIRCGQDDEEGIQYLGADHVAVVSRGRLYLIPYDALRRVKGRTEHKPNETKPSTLPEVMSQWVDPSVNPDSPDEFIWHVMMDRRGNRYRGAIMQVAEDQGIQLRLPGNHIVWLAWHQLGAAVEIMD